LDQSVDWCKSAPWIVCPLAACLELGLRRGLPLATFDAALCRAASAAGAQLL
jgi:hypothetical protein